MPIKLVELQSAINECMGRDRRVFIRDLQRIQIRIEQNKAIDRSIKSLQQRIDKSRQVALDRVQKVPIIEFPSQLPVVEKKNELIETIMRNQVVIVCGETGSGKTTQLPKICLQCGRGIYGIIGHTQPRRMAARSVSARIAHELNSDLGKTVGYKVRFDDKSSGNNLIKIMTDGVLLAETAHDRNFTQYDTIILDEAHERSLNIDYLIGYIKKILPFRPDLKLIITSATIDPEKFSRHFSNAPIVEVSGRTYPVETIYRELDSENGDLFDGINKAVEELMKHGSGDILIFLSGEREIRDCSKLLSKIYSSKADILPLYSRLSVMEQNKVFSEHTRRRIVLATNVAETSLTVPGIRFVIDTGFARISRYSTHSKVQRLPIEKISQASANQRKGRCGRTEAGICIRLYSQEDYESRPLFTQPELLRTNLASVILSMKVLNLGPVDQFPFVEPPERRMINDGYKLLDELGAMDRHGVVTDAGYMIAHLPVDPRIGKMIVSATKLNCIDEVSIIAAALSIQDPRERPREKMQTADECHKEFQDPHSDFMTLVNIWNHYSEQRKHLSKNKLRKWCQSNFLSSMRIIEWRELRSQLLTLLKEKDINVNTTQSSVEHIHQALLSGLLTHVGNLDEDGLYNGTRSKKFQIFPASGLFKKKKKWIMAAQLIETGKLYAHYIAGIDSNWIESLGKHLLKLEHSDPHWHKKSQRVLAYESAKLYGLLIYARRKVDFSNVDPDGARQIFIRSGLVEGQYFTRESFFEYNQSLLHEIENLEHRSRRHDILVDEESLFTFYDSKIPSDVITPSQFEKWLARQTNPNYLLFEREFLMRHSAQHITAEQYPAIIELNGIQLKLDYLFEPGNQDDGVNLTLPLALLNRIQDHRFDWIVPGLLRDKVVALIKSLPKTLRKNFVPATNFADACLNVISPDQGSLKTILSRQLTKMTGVQIPDDAWNDGQIPPYLNMNFRLVDMHDKVMETSRDLDLLIKKHQHKVVKTVLANLHWNIEKDGIIDWDFAELPMQVEQQNNGIVIRGYPALIDRYESVSIKVMGSKNEAEVQTKLGLRRLFMLCIDKDIKYLKKNLYEIDKINLLYAPIGNVIDLKNELITKIVDQTFIQKEITTQDEFYSRLRSNKPNLIKNANAFCELVLSILTDYHSISRELKKPVTINSLNTVTDIKEQLFYLVYKGFISDTPDAWFHHLPRYLKAIKIRLEKLNYSADKEKKNLLLLKTFFSEYQKLVSDSCQQIRLNENICQYKWMIEEYRVSLFAQELKTSVPVSQDRLMEQRKLIKN